MLNFALRKDKEENKNAEPGLRALPPRVCSPHFTHENLSCE